MSSRKPIAEVPLKKGLSDLCAFAIVLTTSLITKNNPYVTMRGFFCDDETIRYPEKKFQIVPDETFQIIFYIGGMGLILLTEFILNRKKSLRLEFFTFSCPKWIVLTYKFWFDFVFGYLLFMTIIHFVKNLVGRLRPIFIDACGPDVDLTDCSIYGYNPILNFNCTKESDIELRLSFPSGHASQGTYALVFLAIYVQNRWKNGEIAQFRAWKHLFQSLLTVAVLGVTVSRFVDNMHHVSDLIAGTLLGAIAGYLAAIYLSCLHRFKSDADDVDLSNSNEYEPLLKS